MRQSSLDGEPTTQFFPSSFSRALLAIVNAGYDPKEFDFAKAVVYPQDEAVFLPVKVTESIQRQLKAFQQGRLHMMLVGLIYAKQPVIVQGKEYQPGLHRVLGVARVQGATSGNQGVLTPILHLADELDAGER